MAGRVVVYHEADGVQPPHGLIVELPTALGLSTVELLGIEPLSGKLPPKTAALRSGFQRVEDPPPADQKVILKFVDALV